MSNNQTNQAKAAQLFYIAAKKGDPEAQFEYGMCCRNGNGVSQNQQEAAAWLRKAAEGGHPGADQALAVLEQPNPPTSQMINSAPPPANPPTGETSAHDKGVGLAVIVGIPSFLVLIFVCRFTVGDGFFVAPESFTNWPGVFIGTGVAAFIAYHIGKNSKA